VFELWFGQVDPLIKTCVLFFIKLQISWAIKTTDGNTIPACDVMIGVVWILDITRVFVTTLNAQVRTMVCDNWLPRFSSYAIIMFTVKTLITCLTEFQIHWEARLTIGVTTIALEKVV